MPASRRARRLRWLAPVAVAAALGLMALVPTLSSAATPDLRTITPDQLVTDLLDQITPSTNVSVTTPAYVADRPVYELVLAPHAAESTIDHVDIAVDAANGMPLQVEVVAKGQSKPAVQLGFTSIDY